MTRPIERQIRLLALAVGVAFLVTSLGVARWMLVEAAALGADPYNPRLAAASADRARGAILARDGTPLAIGTGSSRRYLEPSLAHVVGYLSARFGRSGIESAYGAALIGADPAEPLAALRARYLGEFAPPDTVETGIDLAVQRAAAAALAGRTGAAVALDLKTGAILASVSVPAFDQGALADPARAAAAWAAATADAGRPLLDRAAQGLYPPGSTFKIVTAAAALEAGRLDPAAQIRVDDPYQADPSWGSYAVRSATGAHGSFDLAAAMARSENIYFAKAALAVGADGLAAAARSFGIGRVPEYDLPASAGQLSKSGALDRATLVADTGFGQGELLVSPLQMALATAIVANDGVSITPHVAVAVRDASGRIVRSPGGPGLRVLSSRTAAILRDALVAAVEAPGAFAAGARVPGVRVAGKTGTAENPGGAPHGWFVGFAPADAPAVAVAVVLEHVVRGGEEAAPVGAAVLRAALR